MRYLEDYAAGQVYQSGRVTVTLEQAIGFADQFDPQPFHRDEHAGAESFFGGLVASGWLTAALTMRLLVLGELQPAGGLVGLGADELRWLRPVRPGDELHVSSEVLDVRASRSLPSRGIIKLRITTFNGKSEAVQTMIANLVVPQRPA